MKNKIQKVYRFVKRHKIRALNEIFNRIIHKRRVAQSSAYWDALKDKHKGQRGFVIGNGPSLKIEDLDRLQGEICIASNKIYLAYDSTDWRPTYWTLADALLWPKVRDKFSKGDSLIHLPDLFPESNARLRQRIVYWKDWNQKNLDLDALEYQFSGDAADGFYGGCTVTYQNLQIAVHLGLNPIYIIGCDHYYGGEEGSDPHGTIEATTQNHFHPDYRKPGEIVETAATEYMNKAYRRARIYADRHHLRIYNATRGGFLEVFERRNLDSLFTSILEE